MNSESLAGVRAVAAGRLSEGKTHRNSGLRCSMACTYETCASRKSQVSFAVQGSRQSDRSSMRFTELTTGWLKRIIGRCRQSGGCGLGHSANRSYTSLVTVRLLVALLCHPSHGQLARHRCKSNTSPRLSMIHTPINNFLASDIRTLLMCLRLHRDAAHALAIGCLAINRIAH